MVEITRAAYPDLNGITAASKEAKRTDRRLRELASRGFVVKQSQGTTAAGTKTTAVWHPIIADEAPA